MVLQEVTDTWFVGALRPVLGHAGYQSWPPEGPQQSYDCQIFSRLPITDGRRLSYPQTHMGRSLLRASIGGWTVMTSHLESTRSGQRARAAQLKMVMAEMDAIDGPVVFAGDTNLRQSEVPAAARRRDAWEMQGRPASCRYTWDLVRNTNCAFPSGRKPRARYDRVFVEGGVVQSFELVGEAPLDGGGCWPSDHFGILVGLAAPAHTGDVL